MKRRKGKAAVRPGSAESQKPTKNSDIEAGQGSGMKGGTDKKPKDGAKDGKQKDKAKAVLSNKPKPAGENDLLQSKAARIKERMLKRKAESARKSGGS